MRSPRGGAGDRTPSGSRRSSVPPSSSADRAVPRLARSGERLIGARAVDPESVLAMDDALTFAVGATPGSVVHAMSAGPNEVASRLWSVALASGDGTHLYATCGLSGRIDTGDDRMPTTWELSIAAHGETPPVWPVYLLRYLASYAITTARPFRVGDFLRLGGAISRRPLVEAARDSVPDTALTAIGITRDPELASIDTPRGDIELRRVVGLHEEELRLFEAWSLEGFLDAAGLDRHTDLARGSRADDRTRALVREGSQRDGSRYGFLEVPGIRWAKEGRGYRVDLPGSRDRVTRMIEARLPFGRGLLVHDASPYPQSDVGFEPSEVRSVEEHGDVLVISLPSDDPFLRAEGDSFLLE